MASPIKGLALMVAKKGAEMKKPPPDEEGGDYGEGLEAAMGDLIAAIKKGDAASAASAFKDAMALCE